MQHLHIQLKFQLHIQLLAVPQGQHDMSSVTCKVPSGVRRKVPCTRIDVPVDVTALRPPTLAAASVLTNTCHVKGKNTLTTSSGHASLL